MNPLFCRLAVVLPAVAAAALAYAAGDPKPNPTKPAPDWVKIIDQGDLDPRLKGYKTPEGVKVEIVAEDPVVVNPVGMTFADDGTPYVLEWRPSPGDEGKQKTETTTFKDGSKHEMVTPDKRVRDVVKTLNDTKGKGLYDEAKVVLEDVLPSGILLHDGWLYLSGCGTVRRYRQSKGEGPFDVKEVIARGFGGYFHHQVSGMAIGPDGWLTISAGDGDNVVEGSDGSTAAVLRTGAIFRCRPDGSKIQTYAIGFCNPYGVPAFDAAGNLFAADNDGEGGERFAGCRLMNVVEGADYGWRVKPGARSSTADPVRAAIWGEAPGKSAPMLNIGHGAPSGLLIYNDTRFPVEYRGLVLQPDVVRQSVAAYKVERKGGTFEVKDQFDLLSSDDRLFRPVQTVLGPDGAIYVVDWRSELAGDKPWGDGRHGRILRLTWAGTKDQPALPPRGMDSWAKIAKLGDDDLVKALASDDASDREHARRELAHRGEKERPALLKLFKDADQPDPAREAALGALESMWDGAGQAAAMFALERDSNADVRRLSADALGLNAAKGDSDVHGALLRALNDTAPEARRAAALAMSRVAADGAPDNLVNTLSFDEGRDATLRDGLVRAIDELGKPGADALIALGESGVKKDWDRMVQAFTMMRTRPAADAIPRALENPHLSAAQRVALVRSYENYQLDPPVSLAPVVDYLIAHPTEELAVKRAGVEVLSALGVGPEEARRVGQAYLDGKLPPETRPQVTDILRRHADKDAECAKLLAAVMKTGE